MRTWRTVAALLLVAGLALAPALAEARAGGSYSSGGGGSFMSQGSRGFRTYDQPMQRSMTPQAPSSSYGGQPGYGGGFGYGSYHPFWTGLAGGLFGGWLGSMLFPHWGMGYGGGFGSVFGSLFSWFLILWLLWMGIRMFARRGAPLTTPTAPLFAGLGGMAQGGGGYVSGPAQAAPLAIAGTDYQAFEGVLKHVQGAWSNGDLAELRHYVTPEML